MRYQLVEQSKIFRLFPLFLVLALLFDGLLSIGGLLSGRVEVLAYLPVLAGFLLHLWMRRNSVELENRRLKFVRRGATFFLGYDRLLAVCVDGHEVRLRCRPYGGRRWPFTRKRDEYDFSFQVQDPASFAAQLQARLPNEIWQQSAAKMDS